MKSADQRNANRGRFITFEGLDGAGKSTHLAWFAARLRERSGSAVVVTREPGGTTLGEAVRGLVLRESMHLETETLLMFAARRQHLAEVISPALERGDSVVCDRFTDATFAYQGGGRGLASDKIATLQSWVHPGLEPDLTLLFDVAPEVARRRIEAARDPDRFERQDEEFFARVRAEYFRLAKTAPRRFVILNGADSVKNIQKSLEYIISTICL